MFKTPWIAPLVGALLLAGASAGLAAASAKDKPAIAGYYTWDGRRVAAAEAEDGVATTPAPWDDSAPTADGLRPGEAAGDGGASNLANLAPADDGSLPLAQFAHVGARPEATPQRFGVLDLVNRVRYGRLPEPASWALILIGFGMIGAALRGFVVANRRLARLQPDADGD